MKSLEGRRIKSLPAPNYEDRARSKISAKVTKIVEAESIELEFAGDFVGTEKFTFEPTDGKTKLQTRLNARTTRLLVSFVSPFVNIGKGHSDNMQKGFNAVNSYLCKKYVVKESGLSRLKTHRIVVRFAERGIVTVKEFGNTNEIVVSDWVKS